MPRKRTNKKPPRAREYTGPHTFEAVKEFFQTDALQKAKKQAYETLSDADKLKLMESARDSLREALAIERKNLDELGRQRGYKKPKE